MHPDRWSANSLALMIPLVLVAEDDPADIVLLQRAFERAQLSIRLQFVRDGQETLALLSLASGPESSGEWKIDCLLLDLKMPRKSGFEVLEWLQQHPRCRPQHVVILSGSTEPVDLAHASRLGADHYIVKPADPTELIGIIKRLDQFCRHEIVSDEVDTLLASYH